MKIPDDTDSASNIKRLLGTISSAQLKEKLQTFAKSMGEERFKQRAAKEIVRQIRPEMAIPDVYDQYRALVKDGVCFFLSRIGLGRLLDVICTLAVMSEECPAEERLFEIAKSFPTLHKLGQIIARNRHLEPEVKKWLVSLENGAYGTSIESVMVQIDQELQEETTLDIEKTILSEASVAAVVPFCDKVSGESGANRGVLKVLKPEIRTHLDEELAILGKMAVFFEENRPRYPLQDFKFVEIVQEVNNTLTEEINLASEQINLAAAARTYKAKASVRIPRLMPFCTTGMTAMEYIEGVKITSSEVPFAQRKKAAGLLFEALICVPLFSRKGITIFHGDPHAGNIMAVKGDLSGDIGIALLDWSLAGRLTPGERVQILQLILGVVKNNSGLIAGTLLAMFVKGPGNKECSLRFIEEVVKDYLTSQEYTSFSLMHKSFWLVEQLLYHGLLFPTNLMLFRKTIFTLEGVIHDLDPQFDVDAYMINYLAGLVTLELPQRFGNVLFPLSDRPGNYASQLSNQDLQGLLVHLYVEAVFANATAFTSLTLNQARLMGQFFNLPFSIFIS